MSYILITTPIFIRKIETFLFFFEFPPSTFTFFQIEHILFFCSSEKKLNEH